MILLAYHGYSDTVEFLITQSDANPCQEDNRGNTALMGANPHHKGKSSNSVADIAISKGNYDLATFFVASKESK
nr:hypothetical protein [Alteromonas genovensis]